MSSLGLGEPMDTVAAEATMRVARRLKQQLLPFRHARATREMKLEMRRVIMRFLWALQRTDELPAHHPYMRVVDVEIISDPHDGRHIRLRFLDDRRELVVVPM